ncbi:hypothetical protein [Allokutzneria multivorans]|uniref:hypothetical protein n=1 Tax=Allokutzneria multivorans TaxID=1142134 RepID=UPI0031E7EC62
MDDWWKPLLEPDGLLLRERALAEVDPDALLVALRSCRRAMTPPLVSTASPCPRQPGANT